MEKLKHAAVNGIAISIGNVNKDRLNHVIETMEFVKAKSGSFDLTSWYGDSKLAKDVASREDLLTCGTSACILGWVASTKEWSAAGGKIRGAGNWFMSPELPATGGTTMVNGPDAMAEWLGCSELIGCLITLDIDEVGPAAVESSPELQALAQEVLALPERPAHIQTEADVWDRLCLSAYPTPEAVTVDDALGVLYEMRNKGTITAYMYSDGESQICTEADLEDWISSI